MAKSKRDREHKILRQLLRDTRTAAGVRQIDLAEELGTPQSYVSKYESGERRLDILEVRRVCLALNTTLPAFVSRLESLLSGAK